MVLRKQTLAVTRTARYATLGEPDARVREVGFVCHGYGQLAAQFAGIFAPVESRERLIVAPEGLSRFYLGSSNQHGADAKVGAAWMTREDRENEIKDYVHYLDLLYADILNRVPRDGVRVFALGFSQGAATACRWACRGACRIDHLILWAGMPPPDLDLGAAAAVFRRTRLTLVVGNGDPLVRRESVIEVEGRLRRHHIDYELVRFEGGHHIDTPVLERILTRDARGG
jgi:predicted esterase